MSGSGGEEASNSIAYSEYMCHIVAMAAEPIYTVKKLIALTPEMAEAISGFRFDARIGAEAEAIRRLIELGLDVAKRREAAE